MIPGAPADLDIRACTTMEQVEELAARMGWGDGVPPVILLLDADFDVLHMHVLEGFVGSPMRWIDRYKATYGALVDLCSNLIFVHEAMEVVYNDEFPDFPPFEERVRLTLLFSKETITHGLITTESTGKARWTRPEEELIVESVEAFERLMVNAL